MFKNDCWPDCSEWIIFVLGVIVTIGWALYIYFRFRPKLEICIPTFSEIDKKSIIIPISNKKKFRKATRLKVEAAVIEENEDTNHLVLVEDDFAFLGPNEKREFKAYKLNEYLSDYLNEKFNEVLDSLNKPKYYLRIRVHATDSFSGLGETFEEQFVSIEGDYKKNGFITKQKQS